MSRPFVHLHVHTEFSSLDGIIRIKELPQWLKLHNSPACAITDHGTVAGTLEFYKALRKENIKPILGCEVYITMDPDHSDNKLKTRDNYHLVLLVMNNTGRQTLFRLCSNAYFNNFYYKPRISWENLLSDNEGLIACTACLGGILAKRQKTVANKLVEGGIYDEYSEDFSDPDRIVRRRLLQLSEAMPGRVYIEIQDHPLWEQKAFNAWAIRTSWDLDIPMVITSDAHFLNENDIELHKLIIARQMGLTITQFNEQNNMHYLKSNCLATPKKMWESANKMMIPEAYENTVKIAELCDVEIPLGVYEKIAFDVEKQDDYQAFLKWKNSKDNVS